ncbi:tRNA-(ms[2]io[6]A)-hydroxylase [Saccharophagus sp. K07]|jgi:tRNA-(ms[2]io[6]A)-hydroxylase|uniref:tRNA-(ms[2]io[6]A)-hydroxylase n=1 Tax=Saccharophagus sp. K07 TaxID=2283636 RepID=UPI0016526141|nr:tRNA-(ms[2]io[6]A)-hydroxylase [Saccharophagus sp. K07]MBC6905602.1 tRNA-(ms[2]io[6]A)-hydroxylase [Saccharophagus sp. K07]
MYSLRYQTLPAWTEAVLADFDAFLIDHAAAEKKASGMAVAMLSHYPDKPEIVTAMVDLALEEMTHFREVVKIIHQRGLRLGADQKDPYVNALREHTRTGKEVYLLDRLLIGSIVEARGCERFGLIAEALPPGDLKKFYKAITESEARHEDLFIKLAQLYFPETEIRARLDQLLDEEAKIVASLPIIAALH